MKNMKNYKKYVELMNAIGNDNCMKSMDYKGVCIETPVCDESGVKWFTKSESFAYYGEENLLKVWSIKELNEMPWKDE